jgi:hypothetical protein
MPTNAGTPIGAGHPEWTGAPAGSADNAGAPWYVGSAHPFPWVDLQQPIGVDQTAAMQGQPQALTYWQKRPRIGPETVAQSLPYWQVHAHYDRGAAAFTPHFGAIQYNPIGAGIYSPYKLPVIAGPGARYEAGAIFFDVQVLGTGLRQSPTVPMEAINALIATSHATFGYATTG